MNDRQRLEAIVDVVRSYLPPDGISREEAMSQIIALVDPLPAQPEQEPYCWVQSKFSQGMFYKEKPRRIHTIPLYTAPLSKPWVSLTFEEIKNIWVANYHDTDATDAFAYAIEAKLKEKNNG